ALYNEEKIPSLRLQYKDFSEWQNSESEKENLKRQGEFWVKEFAGEIPVLELPVDYPRPLLQSFEGNSIDFEIAIEETRGLHAAAQQEGATLFMILTAVFNILLAKLSRQEEIIVGTPVAGRRHGDLEKIIGMFVNTLALRNYPSGFPTFREFLRDVKERLLLVFENQEYPFEELVDKLLLPRDIGRNPLFDVMIVLQNMNIGSTDLTEQANGSVQPAPGAANEYGNIAQTAQFDLSLTAMESSRGLFLYFEYCTRLFKKETIDRFIHYFKKIAARVVQNPDIKIKDIEIISTEEKKQIMLEFNQTAAAYPQDKTIQQLFAEQVERTPDSIALVGADPRVCPNYLTYRQLNEQSGRLAGVLIEKGVLADHIVAIIIERSIEMITGILGILKSGGAYLPIDPGYPQERIDYILKDSAAKILLTANDMIFNYHQSSVISYHSNQLAYIIYTSGTTGKPKGVAINHYSLVNRLNWMQKKYPLKANDVILQKTTYTFDVSVWEIFWWAMVGARLCLLLPGEEKDPGLIMQRIEKNNVTTMHFVPSMLSVFLDYLATGGRAKKLSRLKQVFASGEALSAVHVERFNEILYKENGTALANLYGPTEATIDVSYFDCLEKSPGETIPIGKPIDNINLYILEKGFQVQPIGVAGELHIAGVGLARGYLNRPELTAEKFIVPSATRNPFEKGFLDFPKLLPNYHSPFTTHHSPLYRTGDLARWLPDGNIEFLGRIDKQVKIRGFRIELGEIENLLLKHPGIKDAVVLMQDEEDKYLCAYIVPDRDYGVPELREYLLRELPDYMIPAYFVPLAKIPLTANGKIDREALPKPGLKVNENYTAPRNKLEKKLVELWSEVLGKNGLSSSQLQLSIGIDDNFFQLGGHSLKATVFASRIHKELNIILPLAEFFKKPTIRGLSEYLKGAAGDMYESVMPAEEKEYYVLSFAQQRMYILQQIELHSVAYNMPQVIGLPGDVDIDRLQESFRKLLKRHDSLRTSFQMIENQPVQVIHKEVAFDIQYNDLTTGGTGNTGSIEEIIHHFIRAFDLSKAPFLRVGLIKNIEREHILLIDMHHITADGVSQHVLKEDFMAFYEGKELPPLRLQYKDFSEWQHGEREKKNFKRQEEFWLKEFAGEIPVLELPTDYPRPLTRRFAGNTLYFEIAVEETRALNTVALQQGATLFMILTAVFNILVAKLGGQEEIIIGTPIAGRRHVDLEKIIGMFVNTLSLRNYPVGEQPFKEFLDDVKERTLLAFENQEYPFEALVDKLLLPRDTGRNPLFDVMFVLQNMNPETGTDGAGEDEKEDVKIIRTAKFDLTLTAREINQGLFLAFEYGTQLFKEETIKRFIIYFKKISATVVRNPNIKIKDIGIISEAEKEQILLDFNQTGAAYPQDKTISQLFTGQAEKSPDHIAVIGPVQPVQLVQPVRHFNLTYRQLNEQSDRLASVLLEKGVQPDDIIGIMMERSVEMIIAIIGILKSGGAYLPIDLDYPQERIDYMLKDSGAKMLLTANDMVLNDNHSAFDIPRIHHSSHSNLAYIIYTSGTTGKPKGVLIEHKNVVRLLFNERFQFDFNEHDVWSLFHSYNFDFSVWEMYGALLYGGRLVIIPKMTARDPQQFWNVLRDQKVTVLNQTPSAFYNLIDEALKTNSKDLCTRYVIFGGEALKPARLKAWRQKYPETKLVNMFGITETCVHVTYKEIGEREIEEDISHIGKPIPTLRTYIMDRYQSLSPTGTRGELYVGGEGVARGYLNRPELTAERFVKREQERLYRSGDLARIDLDGEMVYLGRVDQQVQLRGFRIELGEIENRLLKHESIKEAVVVEQHIANGDSFLCAYLVPQPGVNSVLVVNSLREFLARQLPDYMVPAHFFQIEKIPITANGKVDKRELKKIGENLDAGVDYTPPTTEIEKLIAGIWKEVLQIEDVGIFDNFFDLGGNSLNIITINNKIKTAFKKDIPLVTLFTYSTIHSLAEYLNQKEISEMVSDKKIKESVDIWEESMYLLTGEEDDDE
ncbi:MAG TPA: amino acid adenylation domain-containing protein, partial [Candidatus Deferrimicrobium sp.]|nr:amino acid adenylation domain-containing protein [Candidatus Deferrimicrobium sp.]